MKGWTLSPPRKQPLCSCAWYAFATSTGTGQKSSKGVKPEHQGAPLCSGCDQSYPRQLDSAITDVSVPQKEQWGCDLLRGSHWDEALGLAPHSCRFVSDDGGSLSLLAPSPSSLLIFPKKSLQFQWLGEHFCLNQRVRCKVRTCHLLGTGQGALYLRRSS